MYYLLPSAAAVVLDAGFYFVDGNGLPTHRVLVAPLW